MKVKHIYWFAYFNLFSPSVRYRGKYPLDLLKGKYNVTSSFIYPGYHPITIFRFIQIYFSALFFRKKDSIIVIQRVHTNFIYSIALKLLVSIQKDDTLYDLDDAEYYDHSPLTINYFLKRCESASAGSSAVKTYAKKYNEDVFILTSPVLAHPLTKQGKNAILTIGWIGDFGGSHRESMFSLFFPAIKNIDFPIKLIILGVRKQKHRKEITYYFKDDKNISVDIPQNINWEDELSVYEKVNEFDIGICPLIDNEITRAKSAFKIKQYFSCGIPALGSNVGENTQFLKHGENGFICNSTSDYQKMISEIKNMDDQTYSLLSANAKKSISKFDMDSYCKTLLAHYDNEKSE